MDGCCELIKSMKKKLSVSLIEYGASNRGEVHRIFIIFNFPMIIEDMIGLSENY